jgi:hypothetical protein
MLTAALAAGALFPEAVLRDAVTHQPVTDVTLYRPFAYLVLAPFCQVLDALTLLSSAQHAALVATVVFVLVIWRAGRALRRGAWRPLHDLGAVVAGGLVLAGVYVLCIVPRPMAALRVDDPALVVVDFHSHTNASRDARKSFIPERNRAWHRAGGWHAAYVTDHVKFDGAMLGMATNPTRAGEDTVLLPGVEMRGNGFVLLALGVTGAEVAALEAPDNAQGKRPRSSRDHPVILTIPTALERAARTTRTRAGTLVGLEVSDAGPRGLDQMRREHGVLVAVAAQRNFAPVAGSNNHGWSYTAPAWTLLRIPGWRELTPEALAGGIEALLREKRFAATRVVERHAANLGETPLGLAVTLPAVAWHGLATLTLAERLSCLAWIWGLTAAFRRP